MQLCSKPQVYFSSSPPLPQTAEAVGRILLFSPMYPAGSNIYPLFALSDKWGGNCIHTQKKTRNRRTFPIASIKSGFWEISSTSYSGVLYFLLEWNLLSSVFVFCGEYMLPIVFQVVLCKLCHDAIFSFFGGRENKASTYPLPACVWWMG